MVELQHPELGQRIGIDRVIGSLGEEDTGPVLVVTAGLHGNEPSGLFALHRVFEKLRQDRTPVRGRFIGLAGHLAAIGQGRRFIDEDLNRAWRPDAVKRLEQGGEPRNAEQREIAALLKELARITERSRPPRYFIDCHTTSAESQPYISVNCEPGDLAWASRFPVYIVSGLEQTLHGTMAEHLTRAGWTGFTFEAGQHDDLASVENQEACIWLALAYAGCVDREAIGCYPHCQEVLMKTIVEGRRRFRLAEHYRIRPGERFRMQPGFVNFEPVRRGHLLAENEAGPIHASVDGRILMPLYQPQGEDGYFLISEERTEPLAEPDERDPGPLGATADARG